MKTPNLGMALTFGICLIVPLAICCEEEGASPDVTPIPTAEA